ncbi:hypothetical protein RJT34_25010 [Clitoria ternatea]|uniref:Uncharacterized protein n=1 Tax=Clitoria ternatea TaxID=43366 RepID=A0AAN9FR28_CLITE
MGFHTLMPEANIHHWSCRETAIHPLGVWHKGQIVGVRRGGVELSWQWRTAATERTHSMLNKAMELVNLR